jgi:hypothetical protein
MDTQRFIETGSRKTMLFLPSSFAKSAGLALGGAAGYLLYKSGLLRPAAMEVLKAGYRVKEWAEAKTKAGAEAPKRPFRKPPVRGKQPEHMSATAHVLAIIKTSRNGVTASMLADKTGFTEKKIRDILSRAYKQGKIQRTARGVYAWA